MRPIRTRIGRGKRNAEYHEGIETQRSTEILEGSMESSLQYETKMITCTHCNQEVAVRTPCKRILSPMMLILTFEDRVLLKIDAWYLLLSTILRADPPYNLNQTLKESMLTAEVEIGGIDWRFGIPQPPEFTEDSDLCDNRTR